MYGCIRQLPEFLMKVALSCELGSVQGQVLERDSHQFQLTDLSIRIRIHVGRTVEKFDRMIETHFLVSLLHCQCLDIAC